MFGFSYGENDEEHRNMSNSEGISDCRMSGNRASTAPKTIFEGFKAIIESGFDIVTSSKIGCSLCLLRNLGWTTGREDGFRWEQH